MAASERARSVTPSVGQSSRENSLAAPGTRKGSRGGFSSSAVSLASGGSRGDAASDLQSSGDGALDKFRRRDSEDDQGETSHRRRISKLFKGRRRRKSVQDDLSQADSTESIPPLPDRPPLFQDSQFQSEESIGLAKSVASSLLTEDSDAENSAPVRPGISPHHSHAAFLTLSSPLIASETVDSPSDTTLVDSATSAGEAPAPHSTTANAGAESSQRGTSSVGKLKEAFAPIRRATQAKDTDSGRPAGGAALGALFGGKRAGPRVLEGSGTQIHDGAETQSTPVLPSSAPKRILTQIPSTPPNSDDAPTTLVTPPTPTDAKPPPLPTESTASAKTGAKQNAPPPNPHVVVSPSGNMISHRRARSATNPPSRLSNSMSAPLTPTLEEVKTPGGTDVPQSPSGFFSSVFSAAQNAANTLSTTIANNTPINKNKTGNQQQNAELKQSGDAGGEEVIGPEDGHGPTETTGAEKRRPAVETLGSGDLSLAHLGIADTDPSPKSSTVALPMRADEVSAKAEDVAAAQAVSAAYASEKPAGSGDERSRALTNASGGAATPPRQSEVTDSPATAASVQRQGSIRSRISGGRRRRHRGSSATTGNTIAAVIGASTTTLAPSAALNGQRLNGTGFAVASPKRNRDFHSLFKSVPEDDYLIEDYSAALQKEILLQGRLYVSEGHLCFSSNILGWVTNLVVSFDEVVTVEKKSTAVVFPNAIVIQTLHARNVFASFLSRDSTYDLIIGIWKISHPNLKSSLNGVALDGAAGTGDKTEKAESVGSDDGTIQDSDDEVYDEDAEEEDGMESFTETAEGSIAGSERGSTTAEIRKASATIAQAVSGPNKATDGMEAAATAAAAAAQDFPGPATHAPTECGDNDQHFEKFLIDTTIPAPLGKIYSMMFGPASGIFMRKWLLEDQKSTELVLEDDKKGLGEDSKTFTYSYIKPLPGSIGPRQTKCNISMSLEQFDLERAVTVLCNTQTPDVPSGNIFVTKTRYCMMWGPNNSTRLIMTFIVEWSGKSWLRGPIEKGASDGQMSYATALSASLRTAVAAKVGPAKVPGKGARSKKRSKVPVTDDPTAATTTHSLQSANQAKQSNWGLFDPIRSLLGPVADILELIVTTQTVMGLLIALLIYSWFFRSAPPTAGGLSHSHSHGSPAARQVAYEEIWRTEESELWKWIEERVALDRVHSAVGVGAGMRQAYEMQDRIVNEDIKKRQMDEAIKVTEEKLVALKMAVGRQRGVTGTKSPREEQT
ncbi:hypothetical protein BDV95DRAFT_564893 [Massariosphaeria phaeospora]|uniref:VASt domain-containing protein n=1 Tax=Massariosphaeria phaeospora TaxID=100035 RepID=A0A7C8MF17_9PLEO|nr:hypothetical protein BDV95DRAFT_564893 [Massariosphaeria phaeospora]